MKFANGAVWGWVVVPCRPGPGGTTAVPARGSRARPAPRGSLCPVQTAAQKAVWARVGLPCLPGTALELCTSKGMARDGHGQGAPAGTASPVSFGNSNCDIPPVHRITEGTSGHHPAQPGAGDTGMSPERETPDLLWAAVQGPAPRERNSSSSRGGTCWVYLCPNPARVGADPAALSPPEPFGDLSPTLLLWDRLCLGRGSQQDIPHPGQFLGTNTLIPLGPGPLLSPALS